MDCSNTFAHWKIVLSDSFFTLPYKLHLLKIHTRSPFSANQSFFRKKTSVSDSAIRLYHKRGTLGFGIISVLTLSYKVGKKWSSSWSSFVSSKLARWLRDVQRSVTAVSGQFQQISGYGWRCFSVYSSCSEWFDVTCWTQACPKFVDCWKWWVMSCSGMQRSPDCSLEVGALPILARHLFCDRRNKAAIALGVSLMRNETEKQCPRPC